MPFQSQVYFQQGFNVPGQIYDDSPIRAYNYELITTDPANNVFGRAFTLVSEGVAQAGGTGVFVGFLVQPNASVSFGTPAGGPLAPTLTLPNYVTAQCLIEGTIVVTLPDVANIDDVVIFDQATGELATIAPGDPIPPLFSFAYATVCQYEQSVAAPGGLAVIQVNKVPVAS